MQITIEKEIEGLGVLKHFGYTTNMKGFKPSDRLQALFDAVKSRKETSHWLSLSDVETKKTYIELMETNPHLFDGDGVDCGHCGYEILVPIDLRRDSGANYHGVCYPNQINFEVNGGVMNPFLDTHNLEQRLKISRVCTPLFEGRLTNYDLEVAGNRERLEKLYWKGHLNHS